MKIVFSVGMYDSKSGIIKVVNNIAGKIAGSTNYSVSILCTGSKEDSTSFLPENVELYNMDIEKYGHRKKYMYYIQHIETAIKEIRPDIIVVSGTEHVLFYSLAVKKIRSDAPKMIVWEHLNFSAGPKFRLEWIGKRIAIRKWDGIVCITKRDEGMYKEHSCTPQKIHQIYNLSDYSAKKSAYSVTSHKIMSCGYLSGIKGFDMAIEVGKRVFARHPDWSWDIYGEGSERNHLESLIIKSGIQKHIHLKGYEKKINSLYKNYAFFVLTSRAEGMGMVLIEALRSGLPVVSFDINCGPSDVITDGKNGYLICPFDIEAMSMRVNQLIEDSTLRESFSARSEMNLKEFEGDYILNRWFDLFHDVVNKGGYKMLFSIITPCFNSEKTIRRTLESVLSQTCGEYEYIIIDGASTDNTLNIIDSYRSRFGNKLRVISEPDNGIYDAMNKGIKASQGRIIGIVNSDDFYEKNCLESVKNSYDTKYPYQIIYGMMRTVNTQGEELGLTFNHHRNMKNVMINHPACFITKALYDKYGCYDLQCKSAADFDFMLRMYKTEEIQFVPNYNILTNFTRGGMSGTYTGIQEDNDVRYKNGIISTKKYILTKAKNALKHYLGV